MENVNFCTLESHNFFVLGPILVKFHIRTRLFESFPQTFRYCWRAEGKLHFTPFHTLRQLKRDKALVSPLQRVTEFERGTLRKLHADFGEWAKFGQRATHGWGKIVVHTCSDLSEPVRTSPQYSDHVRPSNNVIFCTFKYSYSSVLRPILLKLHILTRLIDSFPKVYRLWRCIEVKLSIPLGAHA